jgi:hypothetical protein
MDEAMLEGKRALVRLDGGGDSPASGTALRHRPRWGVRRRRRTIRGSVRRRRLRSLVPVLDTDGQVKGKGPSLTSSTIVGCRIDGCSSAKGGR